MMLRCYRRAPDLRLRLAAHAVWLAARRCAWIARKAGFNPDQPRVPAGSSDGGQWTDAGSAKPKQPEREPTEADYRAYVAKHRIDSGSEVVRRLSKLPNNDSSPANFFATVRSHGWAMGTKPATYVKILLQRFRRVSRY